MGWNLKKTKPLMIYINNDEIQIVFFVKIVKITLIKTLCGCIIDVIVYIFAIHFDFDIK